MSNTTPSSVPAGWYPDPAGTPRQRWWDGGSWTEHYNEPPVTAAQPAAAQPAAAQQPAYTATQQPYAGAQQAYAGAQQPYSYAASAEALKAPAGTPPYNIWIWLAVGTFALSSIVSLVLADLNPSTVPTNGSLLTSALSSILGLVFYGAVVFFAFQDYKALTNIGVPRPFHWAWAFLSVVYIIGRSVVVRRRTGSGILPMWIVIGVMAVTFIVAIVLVVVVIGSAVNQFR